MSAQIPWRPIGIEIDPQVVVDARVQLHHAVSVVSSAARALLDPRPDYSHTALGWDEARGGLFTEPLPGDLHVGLIFADRRLVLSGPKGDADFHLAARTRAQAFEWVARGLSARLGGHLSLAPDPDYALPEHAVAGGAPFSMDPGAAAAFGVIFSNIAAALRPFTERPGASPLRCWPHHFDMATLITLDEGADPEAARSVNVGLSMGDAGFPFPYLYVTPWPAPPTDGLPALPVGDWNTEGWVGARLTFDKVLAGTPEEQRDRVVGFLGAASDAARGLLG
jgi:hypothetical protein